MAARLPISQRMTCLKPSLDAPAVPDLFTPHPNLSDEINRNIVESEIEGGVHLNRLLPGEVLEIETRDWICRLEYRGDHRASISGHPRFCPEPVEVDVCGSTWGGSLLKQHFIGRGMHLEVIHPLYQRILTSRIVEIRAVPG
jgi:hypothetical protein